MGSEMCIRDRSYYGADPKKVQLDEDGNLVGPKPDVQYFTHSFQTSRQRDIAIRLLQSQPPAFQIDLKTITPYQQADARKREKMSDQMVGRLLSSIDAAGLDSSVRDSIIEMVLDTAPESSFMQMFRARKGTRGFVGDITPLEQGSLPATHSQTSVTTPCASQAISWTSNMALNSPRPSKS